MTLLLSLDQISARRGLAAGAGASLADSLATDLEPFVTAPPDIPRGKALLSRAGGRCPADGTELDFDPRSPNAHRCPSCGTTASGELHDRWWLYPYHLWLAERAVHASALHLLRGDARHAAFARHVLRGYAERYLDYPNRDNVLGPSRLFFSTYLESLWLLHICIAADFAQAAGDAETADIVRDRIAEPAARLIAEYDEGFSNRQVWNGAALVAAHAFLGRATDQDAVISALGHTEAIIGLAVGSDGSWYEGDNYHQFAHRGLWYAVALGESLGYEFQPQSIAKFEAGFAAPFLSALPDFTYPARKDSRYAASLRQWRFAEGVELGLARRDDPGLRWALGRMYAKDLPPGDTGRWRSSGEAERHVAPVRLSRADLSWRSLLFARAELPADQGAAPGSLTIMSQGLTIHRRERGDVYVALDWGESGGGHGHPDRLNLLFSRGASRWLDDLGTGSYVDRSLHWYRSTLAHNAPLVNGVSQQRANGELVAAGGRGEFEIASARADSVAPGVRIDRTVVTGPSYFIDEVRWEADGVVRFELPLHFAGVSPNLTFAPIPLTGGTGLEDGFDFVRGVQGGVIPAETGVSLIGQDGDRKASAKLWTSGKAMLFSAEAPGQPATTARRFHLVRCTGASGVIRTVWSWAPTVPAVSFTSDAVSVTVDSVAHTHHIAPTEWTIEAPGALDVRFARPARVSDSSGAPHAAPSDSALAVVPDVELEITVGDAADQRWFSDLSPAERTDWHVAHLGERHYRRTEEAWTDAGGPGARVALRAERDALVCDIRVPTEQPVFVPADATNELDNESPDINGHGVQVYLRAGQFAGAWVIVPGVEPIARVRAVPGWSGASPPDAAWRRVADGFDIRLRLALPDGAAKSFAFDLIVNDAVSGRARRRGQLVLSGAEGEFAYLRGDRHDSSRLLRFMVTSST